MLNGLLNLIRSHGGRGVVVPFSRTTDLQRELLELKNGDFHTTIIDMMSNHMNGDGIRFLPPDIGFEPRSVITIVMPVTKTTVFFTRSGELIPATLPPIYNGFDTLNETVTKYVSDHLTPLGFSATAAWLPQKMLAVHCGLAQYGRNNVTYSDEFGSYMQIITLVSDLPCDDGVWLPLTRMESCESCSACVNACPTGALDAQRRLVAADNCITAANENGGAFPDWAKAVAHNSVVGCTKCQDCCPANAHNRDNVVTGMTFTEEETAELLSNDGTIPFSETLAAKTAAVGISAYYCTPDVLPRNVAALLN